MLTMGDDIILGLLSSIACILWFFCHHHHNNSPGDTVCVSLVLPVLKEISLYDILRGISLSRQVNVCS